MMSTRSIPAQYLLRTHSIPAPYQHRTEPPEPPEPPEPLATNRQFYTTHTTDVFDQMTNQQQNFQQNKSLIQGFA